MSRTGTRKNRYLNVLSTSDALFDVWLVSGKYQQKYLIWFQSEVQDYVWDHGDTWPNAHVVKLRIVRYTKYQEELTLLNFLGKIV